MPAGNTDAGVVRHAPPYWSCVRYRARLECDPSRSLGMMSLKFSAAAFWPVYQPLLHAIPSGTALGLTGFGYPRRNHPQFWSVMQSLR
jgi:hypothetical protein